MRNVRPWYSDLPVDSCIPTAPRAKPACDCVGRSLVVTAPLGKERAAGVAIATYVRPDALIWSKTPPAADIVVTLAAVLFAVRNEMYCSALSGAGRLRSLKRPMR